MPTAPRRRWFQFSLTTVLIFVTLIAMLMGGSMWEVSTIRERQYLRRYINDAGGFTLHYGMTNELPIIRHWDPRRVQKMLIVIPAERFSKEDAEHLSAVFPESHPIRCPLSEVSSYKNRPWEYDDIP